MIHKKQKKNSIQLFQVIQLSLELLGSVSDYEDNIYPNYLSRSRPLQPLAPPFYITKKHFLLQKNVSRFQLAI